MTYGLVGKSLSHSYSKIIHEKLGAYDYDLYNMSFEELKKILKSKNFKGLNVTMPYKKAVFPYCDQLSNAAKKIGSVNTLIVDEQNILTGYNTDYLGLMYTINRSGISLKNKKVIILGNGGTSSTAQVLSKDLSAKEILVVSSRGTLNYKTIYDHSNADIIINTTPVGMYPKNDERLIKVHKFRNLSGVIDVVYNPLYTNLILDAKKQHVPIAGGLPMLVAQAKASAELFKKTKLNDILIEKILKELYIKICNPVLIGMPGSGKTEIGKLISQKIGKTFIDTDDEIEKKCQIKIPAILEKYGEKEFRSLESSALKDFGKLNNLCISTGGGAVLEENNYFSLKQNGRIYWIKRNLSLLEREGRPLSKNLKALEKLYQTRIPLYQSFNDKIVDNNGSLENTITEILKDFYSCTYEL